MPFSYVHCQDEIARLKAKVERLQNRNAVLQAELDKEWPCSLCNRRSPDMLTDETCIGCELDRAQAEVERLKEERDQARNLARGFLSAYKNGANFLGYDPEFYHWLGEE